MFMHRLDFDVRTLPNLPTWFLMPDLASSPGRRIWLQTWQLPQRACLSRSAGRDDLEAPIRRGQDSGPVALDDDVVLDPDPAPARDVDARLDRDRHPRLEDIG